MGAIAPRKLRAPHILIILLVIASAALMDRQPGLPSPFA